MPGFLDQLTALFSSSPKTYSPEPGLTYGPSVSRYTHTPINYIPGAPNETFAPTPLGRALPFLTSIIPSLGAYSTVDSKGSDPQGAARHEDIHNLMNKMYPDGNIPVTQAQKDAIAPSLVGRDTGAGLAQEIPPYMGAFVPAETPLDPSIRDKFMSEFVSTLQQTSPQGAAIYKKLSQSHVPPEVYKTPTNPLDQVGLNGR